MSLASELSDFVLGAAPGPAAEEVRAILRLSLLDWAACGIAGAGEPVARITRDMVLGERGAGDAVLFGSHHTVPPRAAALVNGAASHALDYDDTHFDHIGHPSVAVLPAVLAVARPDQGAEALWAALIGAELSVRIGVWLGRDHYQNGFHQTATAGAFGATAAAGRLLGLTHGQMQAALGVAATRAAGLKSQFGTMGKPYHAGMAASTGVEAALLARAGFDTRGAGLDGPQGFGPTHHGAGDTAAFDRLGHDWRMVRVNHKFHACCHGLHAMLEALATLVPEADPGEVATVTVRTHPRWLSVCNIPDPATGLECKFSYRHTAAMALTGHGTAALESYTDAMAADPDLARLRQLVEVTADDGIAETASEVVLSLRDGRALTARHDLDAPLSPEVRRERLRDKARALLGRDRAAALWQATHGQDAPDLAALTRVIQSAADSAESSRASA